MENLKLYVLFNIWEPVRDYFLRIFYCHHNARVIADFEDRMTSVIYTATNGKMSKPYYPKEVMIYEIEQALSDQYDEGYKDATEELAPPTAASTQGE